MPTNAHHLSPAASHQQRRGIRENSSAYLCTANISDGPRCWAKALWPKEHVVRPATQHHSDMAFCALHGLLDSLHAPGGPVIVEATAHETVCNAETL